LAAGMNAIGRFGIGFFSVFMLGSEVRVYSRRCDKGQESGRLLEFRGGTATRPILSPAGPAEVPIDGGTRVEVRLKKSPLQPGGLLSAGPYRKEAISLSKVVAAVAPNLDVSLAVIEENDTETVAIPGDWLQMKDLDLLRRLNPFLNDTGVHARAARGALMRPMQDSTGTIFGRAFISPERYSLSADGGWVTISGLRANRLRNVQGILLGEAITAARNAAQPLTTKKVLSEWASEQAELIAEAVEDEEIQARSAEVVLECGGNVGGLKIVRWGADWLNATELVERLKHSTEFVVHFDGEFGYDEDLDDVHPKEFRDAFEQGEEIAIVLKHDGSILHANSFAWPQSLTEIPMQHDSKVAAFVRDQISRTWGPSHDIWMESRIVGNVNSSDITREIAVFRITSEDDVMDS